MQPRLWRTLCATALVFLLSFTLLIPATLLQAATTTTYAQTPILTSTPTVVPATSTATVTATTSVTNAATTTTSSTPTTPQPPYTDFPPGVTGKTLSFDFGDGWVAQGQITYPANGAGPFPTVILFHGSGLNDMDQTIPAEFSGGPNPARIFGRLAYGLSQKGYAVVRYNKRGVIGVGPQLSTDTKFTEPPKPFTQYVSDATFVLNQTLKNPLVDPKRVFLLGHSEGTMTASLIARSAAGANVAGIILWGVVGYEIKPVLRFQLIDNYVQTVSQADTNNDNKVSIPELQTWAGANTTDLESKKLAAYLIGDKSSNPNSTPNPANPTEPKSVAEMDTNGDNLLDLKGEYEAYLVKLYDFNNFPNLKELPPPLVQYVADLQTYGSVTTVLPGYTKPVLIQNGEADIQTVASGARAVDTALAGNPDHTLLTYPGLGHSFYPAQGLTQWLGEPQPQVIDDTVRWLNARAITTPGTGVGTNTGTTTTATPILPSTGAGSGTGSILAGLLDGDKLSISLSGLLLGCALLGGIGWGIWRWRGRRSHR
jgi:uncharacterized protein